MKNNFSRNIEMIQIISDGLGKELLDNVVFVGGSTTGLYSTSKVSFEVRYTEDIDCVIKLTSRKEYNDLENNLRKKNFENDMTPNAPICRWIYKGIKIDVMPIDSKILGFTNSWYKSGVEKSIKYLISKNLEIKIFSPTYFIAAKLEAHKNRGGDDIRFSSDFEDIVYILNNRIEILEEINNSDTEVKEYISNEFKNLLNNSDLEEAIECVLPSGYGSIKKIKNLVLEISEI